MALIIFWAVAAAMTLAVVGLMVAAASQGRAEATDAAAFDMKVFRDQLEEVDRDLARGVIAEDEAARLRTEISRRILAADGQMRAAPAASRAGPPLGLSATLVLGVVAAVALGTYVTRGAPGAPDQPMVMRLAEASALRATRPSQAEAEANFVAPLMAAPEPQHQELVAKLREVMANRPDDLQGQQLLARNEAGLGDYPAAARAQAAVIRIKGQEATLEDLSFGAEMMILAASGVVTPEAEALLTRILQQDPRNGVARFQSGRLMLQTGRPDLAFRFWAPLWEESPDDAYWLPILQQQLPDLAWLAGQHRYEMPARKPAARGPSASDVEAASEMSEADRARMIQGMVEGLMARLATEGGTAPEWAQLLRALGVLQDRERATAILAEARQRFAGRDEDLALIEAAARAAGVAE